MLANKLYALVLMNIASEHCHIEGGGGLGSAVHCFPSYSVYRIKGNILQFDNY